MPTLTLLHAIFDADETALQRITKNIAEVLGVMPQLIDIEAAEVHPGDSGGIRALLSLPLCAAKELLWMALEMPGAMGYCRIKHLGPVSQVFSIDIALAEPGKQGQLCHSVFQEQYTEGKYLHFYYRKKTL